MPGSTRKIENLSALLHSNLKLIAIVVFAMVIISSVIYGQYVAYLESTGTSPRTTTTTTTSPQTATTASTVQPAQKGTLVIALKDEDHKIPGGAVVKSMNFTLTDVEVYYNKTNNTAKWVQLINGIKTLDLLKYTTNFAKVAQMDVDAGSYDKIRLKFSSGSISITSTLLYIYNPRKYDLTVPSETVVNHAFNVSSGGTLTLILDFDVENSIMHTADGYSMTPIIKVSEQTGTATNLEDI